MAPPHGPRGRRTTSRRNRKTVQHYTDDNPSTFTTKKPRKGSLVQEKTTPSKRGRRRKRTETTTPEDRKDPPPPPSPPLTPKEAAAPPPPEPPSSPPSPPQYDYVHAHGVGIAPIFPPPPALPVFGGHRDFCSDPALRVAFGRGLGEPRPLQAPEWKQVRYHHFYHPLDYVSGEEGQQPRVVLKEGATPVSRFCTCLAVSFQNDLLAVGDTAGFVSIYSLGPLVMPLTLLSTSASLREYQQEHRQNAAGVAKKTKYGFRVPDIKSTKSLSSQHANAIEALCMLGKNHAVALSTKMEVELVNAETNQIMWTKPYATIERGPAVKLDLHPETKACLASFWYNQLGNKATTDSSAAETPLVLYEWQEDDNSVRESTIVPAVDNADCGKTTTTPLRLGQKCAAMWDRSDADRIVMVTLVYPQQKEEEEDSSVATFLPTLELILVDRHSLAVLKQAPVPLRVMGSKTVSTEALSQSPLGKFTLVASTRGIRLFDTATLSLLRVYGETVSLHGHGIVWQDCFLIRQNNNNNSDDSKEDLQHLRNGKYRERPDELRYRHFLQQQQDSDEDDVDEFLATALVVGVPHAFRQPVELKNTLHFWDAQSDGKHTAFTIAGPPKASGIVTAVHHFHSGNGNNRLVLSTQQGDCVEMVPTLTSEFPGIMYPPGYHAIDDNLEYIEDEDELDTVVLTLPEEQHDDAVLSEDEHEIVDEDDRDLAEAVRRSVLELKAQQRRSQLLETDQEMMDVNVVDNDDYDRFVLPCHPEPYLQKDVYRDQVDEDMEEAGTVSSQSPEEGNVFVTNVLSLLPQNDHVMKVLQEKGKQKSDACVDSEVAVAAPLNLPARGARGKRSRTANLEAMIKASIDPQLRAFMLSKERNWANGEGSTLRPSVRMETALQKQQQLTTATNGALSESVSSSNDVLTTPVIKAEVCSAPEAVLACSKEGEAVSSSNGTTSADILSPPAQQSCEVTSTPSTLSSEVPAAVSADDAILPSIKAAEMSSEAPAAVSADDTTLPSIKPAQRLPDTVSNPEEPRPEVPASEVTNSGSARVPYCPTPEEASDPGGESGKNVVNTDILRHHCDACCGRMVMHVCGKRELPVDFEAIARAEKEKKEKEKAIKLKARIEKRRLNDQKRREAKRKKRLEEQERKKREEEERRLLEIEEAKLIQEEEEQRQQEDHHVKERRRAEILQRLMEAQKEQNMEEERRPEPIAAVSHQTPTNGTEVGRRLDGFEYYCDRQTPAPTWAPPPSPAVPSSHPDNRNDALEALASLANGFVGTSSPHQQSQSPQCPPYDGRTQTETATSRPSYSVVHNNSSNTPTSFPAQAGATNYDYSATSSSYGGQYSPSTVPARYSPVVARNKAQSTPSSYAPASYNQHYSSGTPLSPPPAFAPQSHFGQNQGYSQGAGNMSETYNQVPQVTTAVSYQSTTEHGFGHTSDASSGQGQNVPLAAASYSANPSTTTFRAQVRQGLQNMSSNGHSDQRANVEPSAAATGNHHFEQAGYMGNSSTAGIAIGSGVAAGSSAMGSAGSFAMPNSQNAASYSGLMPHPPLPQKVVHVSVSENHSSNHNDVNNR